MSNGGFINKVYSICVSFLDAVTRDFAVGITDPDVRATVLYPWQPERFVFDNTINKDDIDAILFPNEVCTANCVKFSAQNLRAILDILITAIYDETCWLGCLTDAFNFTQISQKTIQFILPINRARPLRFYPSCVYWALITFSLLNRNMNSTL